MNVQESARERFWRATALISCHETCVVNKLAPLGKGHEQRASARKVELWNRSKHQKNKNSRFSRLCLRCQAGQPSGVREKSQKKGKRDFLPSRSCAGPW